MPDSAVPAQEAAPTANPFAPAAEATAPAPDAAQTFDLDYVKGLRAEAAKARVEAKANADAAKRLAELEAASKTEAERTAERIKSLEDAVAASALEALRARVAAAHGVGPEDAALLLTVHVPATFRCTFVARGRVSRICACRDLICGGLIILRSWVRAPPASQGKMAIDSQECPRRREAGFSCRPGKGDHEV